MKNKIAIIPVFVSHKGCPNDCVFCNQKKITGFIDGIDSINVKKYIDEYIESIDRNKFKHVEIAFYGGSFTGIDIELQNEYLKIAYEFIKEGYVDWIRLSTRPDYIDKDILYNLKKYGVKIIELGVQSLDLKVIEESKRGHSSEDVYKASRLIKEHGFQLGIQVMTGLPGDNGIESIQTAAKVVDIGPDFVRIYPTLIIKNTELEEKFLKDEYIPFTVDKTIEVVAKMYLLFKKNDIPVIRIGLQPTENITLGKDVIGGPFHPAIRSLVLSRVFYDQIICKSKLIDKTRLEIICNPKDYSYVVGDKRYNIKKLADKGITISIRTDQNILRENIVIGAENVFKKN